ncbi:HAD family hydrolase [Roseivirga echinicomitans]
MRPDLSNIDAIIFDLGGVIINLDEAATIKAFAEISGRTENEVLELSKTAEFFKLYETGQIDDPTFRAHLRESLNVFSEDNVLDGAWNAMLGQIPMYRLHKLEALSEKYKLFVMSNTNDIHARFFLKLVDLISPNKSFHEYFTEVYFSQEVGERKPNFGAWQPILNDHKLDASRTLFIDDKLENIQAAMAMGMNGFHNITPDDWLNVME